MCFLMLEGIRNWLSRLHVISDENLGYMTRQLYGIQIKKIAVIMKSTIILDVTPCSLVEIY
jgi:hypothetical protein